MSLNSLFFSVSKSSGLLSAIRSSNRSNDRSRDHEDVRLFARHKAQARQANVSLAHLAARSNRAYDQDVLYTQWW